MKEIEIVKIDSRIVTKAYNQRGKYKRNIIANVDFIKQKIRENEGIFGLKVSDVRILLDAPPDYPIINIHNRLITYLKPLGIKVNTGEEVSSGGEIKEKLFIFQLYDPETVNVLV